MALVEIWWWWGASKAAVGGSIAVLVSTGAGLGCREGQIPRGRLPWDVFATRVGFHRGDFTEADFNRTVQFVGLQA